MDKTYDPSNGRIFWLLQGIMRDNIDKAKKIFLMWKQRDSTLIGRVQIIKEINNKIKK